MEGSVTMMISWRYAGLCVAVALMILGFPMGAHALPMDGRAGKKLPDLKNVIATVTSTTATLSDQQRQVIVDDLADGDPVLVSLAAYAIGQSNDKEEDMCRKAEAIAENLNPRSMAHAFIRLALARKGPDWENPQRRIGLLKGFLATSNLYLRLEAAKELFRSDSLEGREALRTLALDKDLGIKREAERYLARTGDPGEHKAWPSYPDDELYATVLTVIERTGPPQKRSEK
jgi:hypothetical protein